MAPLAPAGIEAACTTGLQFIILASRTTHDAQRLSLHVGVAFANVVVTIEASIMESEVSAGERPEAIKIMFIIRESR